jgi:subtilase family serine protease
LRNDTWDQSDTPLGSFWWDATVDEGTSYQQTQSVSLPEVAPGTYYLLLRVDEQGYIAESNEANNRRAFEFTIAAPDLVPTALTSPNSARRIEQIEVSWTVVNTGAAQADAETSGGWYDHIYFSTDAILDNSDSELGSWWWSTAVTTSGDYQQSQLVTLPEVDGGDYYLILQVNRDNYLYEGNTANNRIGVPIRIVAPDLTPTSLTGPATARVNEEIELTWEVKNQGEAEIDPAWTGSWANSIYLSTNEVLDDADHELGRWWWNAQVPTGATYSMVQRTSIPATPPGSYFLLIQIDRDNNVRESDETITAPDLTPTALSAPDAGVADHYVEVAWSVLNQGTSPAGSPWSNWYDTLYLSIDESWDEQDTGLNSWWTNLDLAAGERYTQTQRVGLPQVVAGNYYLVLRVDSADYLYEGDETNNHRAVPITIQVPDLTPTSLIGPEAGVAGRTIQVAWEVQNQGPGTAWNENAWGWTGWYDSLFLSTDAMWNEADLELTGTWNTTGTSLDSGASYTRTVEVTLPQVSEGDYYLILRTDRGGYVYELDEGNNDRAISVAVQAADLAPRALSAPATGTAGRSIEVHWEVENRSSGGWDGDWVEAVYLSTDNQFDNGDTDLNSWWAQEDLAAGAFYSQTQRIGLPQVPNGTYYLFLQVDRDNYVYESNEANNTRSVAITIASPDLVPSSLTAPSRAVAGEEIGISWEVVNQADGEAGVDWSSGWHDQIYFSSNATWDEQDTLVGTSWITETLAAEQSYTRTISLTLPQVPGGTYYLFLHTDAASHVYETNEANNERRTSIITAVVDVAPTVIDAPASAPISWPIQVSWVVENRGDGAATPGYYGRGCHEPPSLSARRGWGTQWGCCHAQDAVGNTHSAHHG